MRRPTTRNAPRAITPPTRVSPGRPARSHRRSASRATCRVSKCPAATTHSSITGSASPGREIRTPIDMPRHHTRLSPLTRRQWARIAAGAIGLPALTRLRGSDAPPAFVEIPAEKSGILWVHENAMSPDHQLPETMGPGVAFLDYDNDGWMDLFL